MSINGVKISCNMPYIFQDQELGPQYAVDYEFFPHDDGGHINGGIRIPADGLTPTEFNAIAQQAIVDHANADWPDQEFVLSDVIGGRL